MIIVEIDDLATSAPSERSFQFATLREAREFVRQRFPSAIFARGWQFAGENSDKCETVGDFWGLARLYVFPHSQAFELCNDTSFGSCASLVNCQDEPPEEDAILFEGGMEIGWDPAGLDDTND